MPPPVEQPGAPETVPARVPELHHHLSRRAGAGGGLDRLFWLLEGGRAAHRRLQARQATKNHCRGRGARRWRPPRRARGATSEVSRPASGSPGGAAYSAAWAAAIWSSPAEGTRLGRWPGGAATPAASNGGGRRGRPTLAPPERALQLALINVAFPLWPLQLPARPAGASATLLHRRACGAAASAPGCAW